MATSRRDGSSTVAHRDPWPRDRDTAKPGPSDRAEGRTRRAAVALWPAGCLAIWLVSLWMWMAVLEAAVR